MVNSTKEYALTTKVSSATAKANLSELLSRVAWGGERIVIERRGKPVAAIVSTADLQQLEKSSAPEAQPRGALALVGLWSDIPQGEIDEMVKAIYEDRERSTQRPVKLDD
jgi:prevent-host-death family protein